MIKRSQLRAAALIMLCAVLLMAASCAPAPKARVAIMTKLHAGSIMGISEIDGARFFLEQNGIQDIEIVPFDDGWDPKKIESVYREIRARGINIIITSHTSTCALVLKALTDQEPGQVLVLDAGSTTDKLSGQKDFTFRMIPDVKHEQQSIARYVQELGFENLVIVRDTDNPGYTDPGLAYFTEAYGDTPSVIDISGNAIDFSALENQLKASGFKSLYLLVGSYQTNAGAVAQLARTLEPQCPIMYTPWMKTPTLLETAGRSIDGSIIPSHYPPRADQQGVNGYIEAFRTRFNYSPTFVSLNVYRALELLNQALRAGNKSPQTIQTYFLKQQNFETTFGPFAFNPYGDTDLPFHFIHDIPGEF